MGFVLGFFMLVTLIWVFASPKSYLQASLVLGFLLMFGGMIGVGVGLDEAKANLPDEIQILLIVCGGFLGFGMIITSQLTLWAADNNKSVPNVKPDGKATLEWEEELSDEARARVTKFIIITGIVMLLLLGLLVYFR